MVVVEYFGSLVEKDGRSYSLRDTLDWYPHAGAVDRALIDATFHWPSALDLVAGGRRVDGGVEADGGRWERRVTDHPTFGFSFEVGRFRRETATAGHVAVSLAFDPEVSKMGKEVREEILAAVTGSLAYFEELYGPYPQDELAVVTVPRDFSQSTLGLVTLSSLMMLDLDEWNVWFGLEDRRTVIAHEIAHQWWGHAVGWESYRDQWISEAMANYSALLYARNKLDWKDRHGLGPTSGWQEALTAETEDGSPLEAMGPVVLGLRLASSRAGDAYEAIVYKKGAVILDMLSRAFGEASFQKILRQIVKVVNHGVVSTEVFLSLVERISEVDLDPFAKQFVYGTGLPEVYYGYRFERGEGSGWRVVGQARQQAPYRFRYRVVKGADGRFDVGREKLDQIEVASSTLVVPIEIAVFDPTRVEKGQKTKKGEVPVNAMARGHILVKGATTDFDIPVEHEPKQFWLDRDAYVFGRFFDERRQPKQILYFQGLDAAAAGDRSGAEALFDRALAAEVEVGVEGVEPTIWEKRDRVARGRIQDAVIELQRARLFLDLGRDAEAEAALDRARRGLGRAGWGVGELKVLDARLEVRRGAYDKAFTRLRRGFRPGGGLDGTEGYVLLAIAAHATGHATELEEARKKATAAGADLAALSGS